MLHSELDFVAVDQLNVSFLIFLEEILILDCLFSALDLRNVKFEAKSLACAFMKSQCYMKLDVFDPTVFVSQTFQIKIDRYVNF